MGCDQYREALSADLDGEAAGVDAAELAGHLDRCAGCRDWYAAAARVTRLARLAPAEAVPDLAPAVLAALPPAREASPVRRRLPGAARAALVGVAFVQALLAWSGALTGRDAMATGHLATEVGAWNLALAVAFLTAASRPRTADALVAPVGAFVAVLAVSAVADAVAGQLGASRLAAHLLVATGLALLVVVGRTQPAAPPAGDRPVLRPAGPDPADGADAPPRSRLLGPVPVPSAPVLAVPAGAAAAAAAVAAGVPGVPAGVPAVPAGVPAVPAGVPAVPAGVPAGPVGGGIAVGRAEAPPVRAGSAA